jgi:hypothetical protein
MNTKVLFVSASLILCAGCVRHTDPTDTRSFEERHSNLFPSPTATLTSAEGKLGYAPAPTRAPTRIPPTPEPYVPPPPTPVPPPTPIPPTRIPTPIPAPTNTPVPPAPTPTPQPGVPTPTMTPVPPTPPPGSPGVTLSSWYSVVSTSIANASPGLIVHLDITSPTGLHGSGEGTIPLDKSGLNWVGTTYTFQMQLLNWPKGSVVVLTLLNPGNRVVIQTSTLTL